MIEFHATLSARELAAIADLQARTVQADGGRLKLEWGVLRSRSGPDVHDLLCWNEDRLVGFLGIYAFGPPTVELAGMVDPAARRAGIGTKLVNAALVLCRERGYRRTLLVTYRNSPAGEAFALARGAVLDHCEHSLLLTGPPVDGPTDPTVMLRAARADDAAAVARILASAFGPPSADELPMTTADRVSTLIVEVDQQPVGTVRLSRDGDTAGVYGFAVEPQWQGRGIGRDVLRRVCRQLQTQGAKRVGIEVDVDNDHALGLYTSLGFQRLTTEDYYALSS